MGGRAVKRFTETTKWEDGWFSELDPTHKLAWLMLLDRCDNAGVIDRPGRVMSALLGVMPFDWDEFRVNCNSEKERITELDNGKWWLTQFVGYQYKRGVSEASKQHGPIIDSIKKNGLPVHYLKNTQPTPKEEVSDTSQDKDKDKDKEMAKDKDAAMELDLFWGSFPPKARNRSSKQQVRDALKKAKNRPTLPELMEALNPWLTCSDWTKDGGDYIPGAHLWVTRRKWEDAPATAQPELSSLKDGTMVGDKMVIGGKLKPVKG
jgi:hypothetical protein